MGSPSRRRLVARALFCVSLLAVASALFALSDQDVDPDLFWHLRVAELIEATGPQPLIDTFSYNSAPKHDQFRCRRSRSGLAWAPNSRQVRII